MKHDNYFIKPNIIFETIISTYNNDGTPNAAPMGIVNTGEGKVLIKPFKYTDTYFNLKDRKFCVVNFTLDPELFVNCTLFQDELKENTFTKLDNIEAPILVDCQNSYLILKVLKQIKDSNTLRVTYECEILDSKLDNNIFFMYTRAFSSLVEILIHATRILAFRVENNKDDEIVHLLELIEHHTRIINRVAQEDVVYNKLLEKIKNKIMV